MQFCKNGVVVVPTTPIVDDQGLSVSSGLRVNIMERCIREAYSLIKQVYQIQSLAGDLFRDPPPASPVVGPKILYIQIYLTMVVGEPVNGEESKHSISKQGGGLGTTLIQSLPPRE